MIVENGLLSVKVDKLDVEMNYLLDLIQNKLGPESEEIPRWKKQVEFLVGALTK